MASRTRREAVSPRKKSDNDSETLPRTRGRTRSYTKGGEETPVKSQSPDQRPSRSGSKNMPGNHGNLSEQDEKLLSSSKAGASLEQDRQETSITNKYISPVRRSSRRYKNVDDPKEIPVETKTDITERSKVVKAVPKSTTDIPETPPAVQRTDTMELDSCSTPHSGTAAHDNLPDVRRSGRARKSKSAIELLGIKIKKEKVNTDETEKSVTNVVKPKIKPNEFKTAADSNHTDNESHYQCTSVVIKTEPILSNDPEYANPAEPCLIAKVEEVHVDFLSGLEAEENDSDQLDGNDCPKSVIVQQMPPLSESGATPMSLKQGNAVLFADEKSPSGASGNSPTEVLATVAAVPTQRTSRSGRVISSPRRLQDYSVTKDTPIEEDVANTSTAPGIECQLVKSAEALKRKRSMESDAEQHTTKMIKLVTSEELMRRPQSTVKVPSAAAHQPSTSCSGLDAVPVFKKEFIIGNMGKAGIVTVRDKEPLKERVYPRHVKVAMAPEPHGTAVEGLDADSNPGEADADLDTDTPAAKEYELHIEEEDSGPTLDETMLGLGNGDVLAVDGDIATDRGFLSTADVTVIEVSKADSESTTHLEASPEETEKLVGAVPGPVEPETSKQDPDDGARSSHVIVVAPHVENNGESCNEVQKTEVDPDMPYYEMMVKLASEVVQQVEGYDKDLVYRVEYGEGKVTHMVLKKPDDTKPSPKPSNAQKGEHLYTKGMKTPKKPSASRKNIKNTPVTSEELALQETVFGLTAKGRKRPIKQVVVKKEFQELIDKLEPSDNIEDHIIIHNFSRGRSKLMTCKHCGLQLSDRHHFRKHIRSHPEVDYKPFACPLCGYRSQIKAAIARHINIHSDVMPYVCVLCGRGFNFKQKLQIHMKYHSGVRDQQCPHCDLAFHENKTLRNHMRAIHNTVINKSKNAIQPASVHGVLYPEKITSPENALIVNQTAETPQTQGVLSNFHQVEAISAKQEATSEASCDSGVLPNVTEITQFQHIELAAGDEVNMGNSGCEGIVAETIVETVDDVKGTHDNLDGVPANATCDTEVVVYQPTSEESSSNYDTQFITNAEQVDVQVEDDSTKHLLLRTPSGVLAVQRYDNLSQDGVILDVESQQDVDDTSNVQIWYEIEHESKPRLRFSRCTGANKTRKITERYMQGLTKFGASHREIEATKPWKKSVKDSPPEPVEVCDLTAEAPPKPNVLGNEPLVSMQQLDKTLGSVSSIRKVMMANKKLVSTYHCKLCGLMFSSRTLIVHHIEVNHPEVKLWECPDCTYTCRLRSSLFVHRKLHEGPKKHDCKQCGKAFSLLSKLKEHMTIHSQAMDYKCDQCGKNFRRKGDLKKHEGRIHSTERPLKCDMCEKSFRDKVQLRRHMESHVEGRTLLCEICLKYYKSRSSLQQHIKSHMCRFYCELCNKPFGSYSGFMAHKVMHTESFEGFSCDLCGKVLHTKGSLNRHLTISHSTARPFQCLQCKNAFKTKKDLRNHAVVHSSAKDFACSDCGFKSKRYESLQVHRRRHQEVKPYRCGVCGREYTQKRSLQMHLPYHLADLQIKCPYCKKRCMSKNVLEQHIKRYHSGAEVTSDSKQPVTFFMCEECNCVFLTQDNLAVHILVEHMQQTKDGATNNATNVKEQSLATTGLEYELTSEEVSKDIDISRDDIANTRKALEGISMGGSSTAIVDMGSGKTQNDGLTYVAITDPKSQQQRLISLLNPVDAMTDESHHETSASGCDVIGQGIEDVEVEGEVIMNLEDALTEEALQHIKVEEVTATEDSEASEHVRQLFSDSSTSVVAVSSDNMALAMSQAEAMDMTGDMSHGTVVSFLDPNTQETFSVSMPQQALENLLIPAMETEVSMTTEELSEAMVIPEGSEVHVEESVDYC